MMNTVQYNFLKLSFLFTLTAVLTATVCAERGYPDLQVSGPTDQFPAEFAAFNPPVDADYVVPDGAPQIAEWTRQNQPGDTLVLTGENFTSYKEGEEAGRDTRFIVFGQERPAVDALVQRLDGRQAAITLPENLPEDEVYLMWPANSAGFGAPVAINKAEAWWIGLDWVAKGETFSVFGQNLALGGQPTHLYIEGYGWLESNEFNPYKADFVCPDLALGTYTVYAHNGFGGAYGWSEPRTLTVVEKLVWDDDPATWTDVTDYGAKGDGITDDAEAINAAYNAIKDEPLRTLYFPEGTYLMGSRLYMNGSGSVRIKGDGMGASIIKPYKLIHPYKMINVRADHTRFEDLTVETGGFGNDLNYQPLFNIESCSDIRFTRMQLMQTNATSQVENHFRALTADHLYFEDCEFYTARSTWFENSEDIIIKGCIWYGVHDSNNLLGMETSRAAVFDCTARMLDSSDSSDGDGWAKGRWIAGGVRGWNNFYVGTSKTIDMVPRVATPFYSGVPIRMGADVLYNGNASSEKDYIWRRTLYFSGLNRPNVEVNTLKVNLPNPVTGSDRGYNVVSYDQASGEVVIQFYGWESAYVPNALPFNCSIAEVVDQNSSEQILFEGGNTSFRGPVSTAAADSVTLPGYGDHQESDTYGYVTIVDGRGLGQSRQIGSNSGDTIYLKEAWNVIPDSSSRAVVGRFCHRFVVYNNDLDSVPSTSYSASVGFQITGSGHSVVVDGNRISQTRSALSLFAESQAYFDDVNIVNPIFFGLYQNNVWSEHIHGISLIFGNRPGVSDPYPGDKAFVGNVFRRNSVSDIQETGFLVTAEVNDHVGLSVLADSEFTRVKNGVEETGNSSGILCLGNRFSGTGSGSGVTMSGDNAPLLLDNTWESFDAVYSGILPGPTLHLPSRYITVSDAGGTVKIRNGGTSGLKWKASEQSDWLNLPDSEGYISNEVFYDVLTLELASEQFTPDEGSTAIITVIGDNSTNTVTAVYVSSADSVEGDKLFYPLAAASNQIFRIEVYNRISGETKTYEVPYNASEVIVEGWMVDEWSRMRIQMYDGVEWITVHEEWTVN